MLKTSIFSRLSFANKYSSIKHSYSMVNGHIYSQDRSEQMKNDRVQINLYLIEDNLQN